MTQENKTSVWQKFKNLFKPADLTKGKEWKVLLVYAVPIIISYLLQQFYILSDSIICGQTLSIDEVTGVNNTFSLSFFVMQFAFGCTAGFCVITAKRVGNKDADGVRKSFATQMVLCLIITVVLTVVACLTVKPLLSLVNVTPKNEGVYIAARDYLFIIFLGIFAQMFYNFIISILRSYGDSFTPLVFLIISTSMNIALDLLFIKVFGWGVKGAAVATVLTQALCTVACFIYTFVKYKELRLTKKDFRLTGKDVKEHLYQGLPLGLQFSVLAIGIIVMASQTVKFDMDVNGIMDPFKPVQNGTNSANKMIEFLIAPLSAFGSALVSFTAQNVGAQDFDRVKRGTNQGLIIATIMGVVLAGIGFLLCIDGVYQKIFLSAEKITDKSLKYGTTFFMIDMGMFVTLAWLFVLRGSVQGIEQSIWTLLAGAGELVARVVICTCLPTLVLGGKITSEAGLGAYIALSFGDAGAWVIDDIVLFIPYMKHIVKKDYRYLDGIKKKRKKVSE